MGRLVIDGNSVYEIDEECIRKDGRKGITQRIKIGITIRGKADNTIVVY